MVEKKSESKTKPAKPAAPKKAPAKRAAKPAARAAADAPAQQSAPTAVVERAPAPVAPTQPAAKQQPAAKKQPEKAVKVTQVRSPAGRYAYQRATLKGLGLNKMNRSRVLEDTPSVRGMIERVKHLVRVESVA